MFSLKKLVAGIAAEANPFDGGKTYASVQKQAPAPMPSPVQQKIQTAKYGVLANNPQAQQRLVNDIKPVNFSAVGAARQTVTDIGKGIAKPFQQTGNMAVYGGKAVNSLIDVAQKQKTSAQATADLDRYSRSGGTFGAGLPKSFQGVDRGSQGFIQDPAKIRSAIGTGSEIGSTLVPVGKGLSVAKQGTKVIPKLAAQSAPVAAVGSAGSQYAETGKINPTQLVTDTAIGTALGIAPPALFAGAKKGLSKATVTPQITPTNLVARNDLLAKRAQAELTKPAVVPMIDKQIAQIDQTTRPRFNLPFRSVNNQIGAVGRNVLPDPLEALKAEARKYKTLDEFRRSLNMNDNVLIHQTGKNTAKIINKEGFKPGSQTGLGEKRNEIYGMTAYDWLKHGRMSKDTYARDGSGLGEVAINTKGLKIFDRSNQKFTDAEYVAGKHKEIPKGYDGVKVGYGNGVNETLLTPEAANKARFDLTDLYNQAHTEAKTTAPKVEAPQVTKTPTVDPTAALKQEALKYKSADEFVKAQGEPVYHGTGSKFDKFDSQFQGQNYRQGEGGFHFTSKKSTAENYATLGAQSQGKASGYVIEAHLKLNKPLTVEAPSSIRAADFYDDHIGDIQLQAMQNGNDGIIVKGNGENLHIALSPDVIHTKQQLTDLYNQATQKKSLFKPLNQGGYVKNPLGKEGVPIEPQMPKIQSLISQEESKIVRRGDMQMLRHLQGRELSDQDYLRLLKEANNMGTSKMMDAAQKAKSGAPIEKTPNYMKDKVTPEGYFTEGRYKDSAYPKSFVAKTDIPDTNIKAGDKVALVKDRNGNFTAILDKPYEDGGFYVRREHNIDPNQFSTSGAPIEKTAHPVVKEYATMLRDAEKSLKGGQMIGDHTNGYSRISEHTPFYRDYYARNGKAPTIADWQAEAERQLKSGKAEGEFQKAYNDQANPEVASLLKEADKGAFKPGVVISEAVNKGSGTKVQRGIEVVNGKPQRFERTVASKKLESIAKKELPNVSEKPVELKSIEGKANSPVKKQFIDLTNDYLGSQKAGRFNAVDRAKKFNEQFGNLTEKQKNEVIFATDDPKFGTKDPAVQRAVDYLHSEFDSAYQMFTKDRGLKLNYQQSYYPRQYVNKLTGEEMSAAEYNLLQRSSARQKGRTSDTLAEWKLVTRDPAEALVKYYSSLEKAAAGQKYLNGLKSNGLVISSSEPVRGMQPVIAEGLQDNGMIYYAKADVAKQLNKLFGSEKASGFFEKSLEKAQGFNSFMQSFVLSGGVPNTPLNAFGFMQLMKSGMALHPMQGGKAFYMGMTRKGADKFFENHQTYLQDMAKNGLDIRYDYRPQMKMARADIVESFKDKGAAKAIATGWDELTNDATFGRFMPALETLHFKGVYDSLIKKMPADEAAKTAAQATANFFGKNTMAKDAVRSKVGRDASGALLFAPRFRESMLNFWVKNAQALKPTNWTKIEYRDNMKFMAAAALTYAAMDGINYSANGVHMYQNPDGKKDKLLIPGKDGQYVGVPFLPSIATVPRNVGMGVFNLATGNINEAGKNAKSFLSIPARAVGDIATNENYFGAPIVQKGATGAERAAQIGSYLVKGNMQPWIREGMNAAGQKLPDETKKLLGVKKQTGVQTASQALELPFRFYDSQNFKGGSDNFKTADGSTLGQTRAANVDTRDEIMKAALSTPEAKRFFANSDAKQQELADNDPNLKALYDQRKAMLTGLKSDKIASAGQALTDKEAQTINSWNRLTTEAKNKVAKQDPARKQAYDVASLKSKLAMGEIDKTEYDKKLATLTKVKSPKKTSTVRKSTGTRKSAKSNFSFATVSSARKTHNGRLKNILSYTKL